MLEPKGIKYAKNQLRDALEKSEAGYKAYETFLSEFHQEK